MHIDPKDSLFGFPILGVRKLLKTSKWADMWGAELIQDTLSITGQQARELIKDLEKEGYIEQSREYAGKAYWVNTLKGNQLALASAAKPLTRSTAERRLAEFLARVKQVCESDNFIYKVKEVRLFGSYLTASERLGDIDLGVDLVSKIQDKAERDRLEKQKREQAERNGRRFGNYVEYLGWPQIEVLLFLKNKSRAVSIHPMGDPIAIGAESKVIYKDEEDSQ